MGTVFHMEDTLSRVAPCRSLPSLSTTRQKMTIQSFHWLSCARRSDASGRTERRRGRGAVAWRPAESRSREPAVARSGPASSAGLVPSGASWWRCTSASPGTWRRLEPPRLRRRFIRLSHPAVTGLEDRVIAVRSARARLSGAVGGGSATQLGTAPKAAMARTSASKAPPASPALRPRLLTVAGSPRRPSGALRVADLAEHSVRREVCGFLDGAHPGCSERRAGALALRAPDA